MMRFFLSLRMNYLISKRNLKTPDSINCNYFIVDKNENRIDVLIVSFSGNYPNGSLGKNHAKFITTNTITGLINFDPDAVILDFRELEYNWGNNILDVFECISFLKDSENSENEPNFPVLLLVSEKSKNGILSLLNLTDARELPNWISEDLNIVIENAIKKGKYWLDY